MFFKIIMALIYILFSLSAGNILVIPTYEFLTFPFMTFRNPFVHLLSFAYIVRNKRYKFEKALKESNQTVNIFLIIVEVFYVLGFLCFWASITPVIEDWCKLFILVFIYTYYLLMKERKNFLYLNMLEFYYNLLMILIYFFMIEKKFQK